MTLSDASLGMFGIIVVNFYLVLTLTSLNFNHDNKYIDVVRKIRFVWILDDNYEFVLNIQTVAKVVI